MSDLPVCKVLSGYISDGQLREHHFSSTLNYLVQLVIEDLPFSVHHLLVLLWEGGGGGDCF